MKFAVVDLETTGLDSDRGFLLCAGIKPLGGKAKVVTYDDSGFESGRLRIDRKLVLKVRDSMESFDGWITWNGLLFDIPLLNGRLTLCDEDPLERRFMRGLDMMWHAAQNKTRFTSRRLDWVAKALGCPYRKTDLDMNAWKEAESEVLSRFKEGREKYDLVVRHCLLDLKVTEWVYDRLKPYITTISKG